MRAGVRVKYQSKSHGSLFWVAGFLLWYFALTPFLQAADTPDQQLQNRLRAHIEFLADDRLRGRQPGSDGYNIAANYVASQFLQMGLLPAGNDGRYFQQVPLRQAFLEPGSGKMMISRDGENTELIFVEQFFMRPSLGLTSSRLETGLVFVGYGIDAPELDYSDYGDIDVNGKVVVSFAGQPHDFPSEEGAHFASGTEKLKAAVRHGAIGVLIIHTPRAAQRFHWEQVASRVGMPSMGWINEEGQVHGEFEQLQAAATLSHAAAEILFEETPFDLSMLIEKDERAEVLPVFELYGKISMSQRSAHQDIYSPNVVGVLRGSDPLLADEYVVYTAHLDHIGELHAENSANGNDDRINNGALDNASGVSVMLETARLFVHGEATRRSIMFIAVTAEEKGLVGSEYFAMNPTVPIKSIVSEVNLDMPLLLYDFGDVIAFGAEHSSLGETVREAAGSFGTELTPDPFPEQNIFVRSDHYRFVQQGVPSVFLVTGEKSLDESIETQPIFEGFLQQHYHKPSDDLNLPIHYGAAARFTHINAKIGEIIANESARPRWHEGDFFGRTYAK
jgi:Zn-dependent M28 family amino/carboxypeptidase